MHRSAADRRSGTGCVEADRHEAGTSPATPPSRNPGAMARSDRDDRPCRASNEGRRGCVAGDRVIVMTDHGCVFEGWGESAHTRRTAAMMRTADALYLALSGAAAGTARAPGGPFDPAALAGRSVAGVIDALVEVVCPVGDGAEASRPAVRKAVAELLECYPDADLLALSEEQFHFAVEEFVANDFGDAR